MVDYLNSQIAALIEEHIHSDRDAEILRLRLMRGHTYEQIACEIVPPLSDRQVRRIISKHAAKLFRYLSQSPE